MIGNNQQLIEDSKLLYYANAINYPSKEIAEQCRVSNKYFEFLHMDYAKEIDIKIHKKGGVEFIIKENELNPWEGMKEVAKRRPTYLTVKSFKESMNNNDCPLSKRESMK